MCQLWLFNHVCYYEFLCISTQNCTCVCGVCVLCIYVFSKLKYTQCMYTCGLCMHICRCAIVCICVRPYLHLLYCALQSTGLTIPENTENEMFACANVTQVNGNKNTSWDNRHTTETMPHYFNMRQVSVQLVPISLESKVVIYRVFQGIGNSIVYVFWSYKLVTFNLCNTELTTTKTWKNCTLRDYNN